MKNLFLVFIVLSLSACSWPWKRDPDVIDVPAPQDRTVRVDERLMVECEPLTDLKANPKPSEVILQHGADTKLYSECASGKKKLIEAVRAAFPKDK
jgi:hypothetical protein